MTQEKQQQIVFLCGKILLEDWWNCWINYNHVPWSLSFKGLPHLNFNLKLVDTILEDLINSGQQGNTSPWTQRLISPGLKRVRNHPPARSAVVPAPSIESLQWATEITNPNHLSFLSAIRSHLHGSKLVTLDISAAQGYSDCKPYSCALPAV